MLEIKAMTKTKNVLIIDDSIDDSIEVQQVLEDSGYNAIFADNVEHGFELAQQHRPDIIVLDVVVEDDEAFDWCIQLQEKCRLENVPILLVSSRKPEEDSDEDHLKKGSLIYHVRPYSDFQILNYIEVLNKLREVLP